ncbi:MaoC family dehydratase [Demequina aurantiaca]|uniref:MaoC family dehydratase n=1 Tax=Demequina aurantiaca TaxID=676200 RepID=UPI000784CBE9|nr:MaoC/PaaZ C-terminal domain-containing protein [Demequina aurantiaca]
MERREQHLDELPSMGTAFARALVPSRAKAAKIPRQVAVVDNQRQDLARLAEYNRVCGFTLRDTVPPTWLHVLTFPLHVHLLGAPDSSIKLVGAVHVSNSMTLHRPVGLEEKLQVRVHIDNLRPHKRGAMIDLIGQVRVGDETVWDGTSTYLATGMSAPGEVEDVERQSFEPLQPQAKWRLAKDLGRRYRKVSHDPNPIHTSTVAAKAFGFARPIIHGMWTHARALAALEGRLPEAYETSVSFLRPILLPGTVGFATSATEQGYDAAVTNRDGSKAHLLMGVTGAP